MRREFSVLCELTAVIVLVALAFAGASRADLVRPPPQDQPLIVAVSLHPYYSWVSHIGDGTPIYVESILPGDVDAGAYSPRPQDIAKLTSVDVIVKNGLGHDDFLNGMITASASKRPRTIIDVNKTTKTIGTNSHTFISFDNAIAQTNLLVRELSRLRPAHRTRMEKNAAAYISALRALRDTTKTTLQKLPQPLRAVTVHDGYSYLLKELGVQLVGVVEPAHGLVPSAQELSSMVALLKREKVSVVFTEEDFPDALLLPLREAGARVFVLSHVATGPYTAEKFDVEMRENVRRIEEAFGAPLP